MKILANDALDATMNPAEKTQTQGQNLQNNYNNQGYKPNNYGGNYGR